MPHGYHFGVLLLCVSSLHSAPYRTRKPPQCFSMSCNEPNFGVLPRQNILDRIQNFLTYCSRDPSCIHVLVPAYNIKAPTYKFRDVSMYICNTSARNISLKIYLSFNIIPFYKRIDTLTAFISRGIFNDVYFLFPTVEKIALRNI